MEKLQIEGVELYKFSNLESQPGVRHFVSSRRGGFSKGAFSELNTGFHVGDDNQVVLQNRQKLTKVLNAKLSQFTFANQTHSRNTVIAYASHMGRGAADGQTAIPDTDALVTHHSGIYLCVQMADCVPVLLYDPVKRVTAAIHAGWRGTLRRVTESAVRTMINTCNSTPSNILAGIGPSNGPCCYQVGEDVKSLAAQNHEMYQAFVKPAPTPGKYIFDQWTANLLQLQQNGIPRENIELAGICTQCHSNHFFSSRNDGGNTGRFAAGIMLF